MIKVCAIIVTYNRPTLLCRCVSKLLAQDYPLDIFIYDNHSSDNVKSELENNSLINERVTYYYADENTGGSGGFHNAMKIVSEENYDALWLMDDDGYPINDNTLSLIVNKWSEIGEIDCILNSLVVCDEESLRLSFSLDREYDGKLMVSRAENGLLKNLVSPFNGTFIPLSFAKKIGFPIKEFFVYGDETEYMLRVKANGGILYTVVDSLYFHPSTVQKVKRFFGRKVATTNIPMWKVYCSARNTVFYVRKYFGIKKLLKSITRIYVGCILADKNKCKRIKTATRGIIDGLKSNFNRPLDLSK